MRHSSTFHPIFLWAHLCHHQAEKIWNLNGRMSKWSETGGEEETIKRSKKEAIKKSSNTINLPTHKLSSAKKSIEITEKISGRWGGWGVWNLKSRSHSNALIRSLCKYSSSRFLPFSLRIRNKSRENFWGKWKCRFMSSIDDVRCLYTLAFPLDFLLSYFRIIRFPFFFAYQQRFIIEIGNLRVRFAVVELKMSCETSNDENICHLISKISMLSILDIFVAWLWFFGLQASLKAFIISIFSLYCRKKWKSWKFRSFLAG